MVATISVQRDIDNGSEIKILKKEILDALDQAKDAINNGFLLRANLTIKVFSHTCRDCGKKLTADECYDYCGLTLCSSYKSLEEEVDEECR